MTCVEMKLVKFKTIISELWKNFPAYYKGTESPISILFGSEWKDEFSEIIVNNTFNDNIEQNCYDFIYRKYDDIESLIEISLYANKNNGFDGSNLGEQTVFFCLMALAIDADSYNERLSILTDFAYLVGFDEDMMSDWICAVKSVLSAKTINLSKFKSEKARTFFSYLNNVMYEEE